MKDIFKFKRYNIFYVIVMLIVCSTIIILSNTSVNRKKIYIGKTKKYQSSSTVYKTSNDTINVLIRGTDENYLSNTLTENDVSIKVNGTIVNPSIKMLGEAKNITNGIQYTLQLFGVTGNGPLIVEVKENTLEDKAENQNITKVYETRIVMDNN